MHVDTPEAHQVPDESTDRYVTSEQGRVTGPSRHIGALRAW